MNKIAVYPLPPKEFMFLATGGTDENVFLATGRHDQETVLALLKGAGLDQTNKNSRILDWGCGCGRLARHWAPPLENVELYGCDIADGPVRWCQDNLTFGKFAVSKHSPPLPHVDGYFDGIYAISVLTHLTFDAQYLWMGEIWRLLKPEGIAVLTAHGNSMLQLLATSLISRQSTKITVNLINDDPFLCVEQEQGSNDTGNYENASVFTKIFHPFEILKHRPRNNLMGIQDTYVLRKKSSKSLTLVQDFFAGDLVGADFHVEIKIELNGETHFSVLAAARELMQPATIRLTLRRSGDMQTIAASDPVELPALASWARLENAFAFLALECGPAFVGPCVLCVDVTAPAPLQKSRLQLKQAMLF
ncbi:MAG: class I SAM-dependent methyltransferase [Roseiarcus sp.]